METLQSDELQIYAADPAKFKKITIRIRIFQKSGSGSRGIKSHIPDPQHCIKGPILFQIPSGERLIQEFPSTSSLEAVLSTWNEKLGDPQEVNI